MFAVYADRPEADDRPRGRRHHPARRAAAGILQARLPLQIPVGTLSGAQSVRVNVWDPVRRASRDAAGETRRPTALAEVTWAGETESGPAAPGHLPLPGHDRRIGGERDLPHRGVDPGLRRSLTAHAARHTGTAHRCCREQHGVVLACEPQHSWGTFPVLYADGITRRRSATSVWCWRVTTQHHPART